MKPENHPRIQLELHDFPQDADTLFLFASVLVVPCLNQLFANNADNFWTNLRIPCPSCQQAKPLLSCFPSAMWRLHLKWTTSSSNLTQMNQPAVLASSPLSPSLFAVKIKLATSQRSTNFMQQCSLLTLVLTLIALWSRLSILLMMNCRPHRDRSSPCQL